MGGGGVVDKGTKSLVIPLPKITIANTVVYILSVFFPMLIN